MYQCINQYFCFLDNKSAMNEDFRQIVEIFSNDNKESRDFGYKNVVFI